MKKILKKYRLNIAAVLIVFGLLFAGAEHTEVERTYLETLLSFTLNFIGIGMAAVGGWLCNKDYKENVK